MIAPMFDEEAFVRDVQIEIGFEHELLAQKILEVARAHYTTALGNYNLAFLDSATDALRGELAALLVKASKPQEVSDAVSKW